jgi:hypothetical protein
VRKLRAAEDQSAPIPEEITSELGWNLPSNRKAILVLNALRY